MLCSIRKTGKVRDNLYRIDVNIIDCFTTKSIYLQENDFKNFLETYCCIQNDILNQSFYSSNDNSNILKGCLFSIHKNKQIIMFELLDENKNKLKELIINNDLNFTDQPSWLEALKPV